MARGTRWAGEPRCAGWAKAWAIMRRSRSKNAQEKSPRVLMFVEYAARRRVAPISSVMASSALRMTSKRTGSTSGARARGGTVEVVMAGPWYRRPPCHDTRAAALTTGAALEDVSLRQQIGDADDRGRRGEP